MTDFSTSLKNTCDLAHTWFINNSKEFTREKFAEKGGLNDKRIGSVYVYFDDKNHALYAGETSRAVKARLHDQTSPHKSKDWWGCWKTMRFSQIENQTDRLVLEMLLILQLAPTNNQKPSPKEISKILTQAQ